MLKVSVIVPVYNSEKYLSEMIEALMAQTLNEFEVIFVLDCPTDASESIVRRYQEKDDKVKIIENATNRGAAYSRNAGLSVAKAEYLLFLDSDDIFEKDMLERAYEAMVHTSADMVLFEHDVFNEEMSFAENIGENDVQTEVFSLKELPQEALTYWNCVVWNKMFRRKFIMQNQLLFQDLHSSNDVYFSDMAMILAKKIVHVNTNKKLLHHRVNISGQISASRNPICAWKALCEVYHTLQLRNLWKEYSCYFYIKFLHTMTTDLRRCKREEDRQKVYQYILSEGYREISLESVKQQPFENKYFAEECCKFMTESYESGWYQCHVVLYAQLQARKEEIVARLRQYESEGMKLVFWGAGPAGKSFIRFCLENGINLEFLIDNDSRKQGKQLDNVKIVAFEEVYQQLDVVICSNRNHMLAIREQIMKKKPEIELLDLNQLVCAIC